MEIIKQGYMVKRGHIVHNWKARWFVLDGESLSYYTCKGDTSSKGSINLQDCQVVSPCLDYTKRPMVFKVVNKKQELVMQASSLEERDTWVLDLRSAARCLQEGRPFTRSSLRQSIRLEHSLNLREILTRMKNPESGIKSESFNSNNKVYKDCFTGACMVNWLLSEAVVRTRTEGVLAGLSLLEDGYIRPTGERARSAAHSDEQFLDDTEALYFFIDSRHCAQESDSDDECSILREEFRGRVIKQGCMLKQGHKRLNWKIRKFVLREEPAYLHYYDPTKFEAELKDNDVQKLTIVLRRIAKKKLWKDILIHRAMETYSSTRKAMSILSNIINIIRKGPIKLRRPCLHEDSRYPLGGFAIKNSIISAMGEDGLPAGGDKVQGNLIHIITPEDVHYYMQASTTVERQQWIEAIKRLC